VDAPSYSPGTHTEASGATQAAHRLCWERNTLCYTCEAWQQQPVASVMQGEEERAGLWMTRWLSQEVGCRLALTPALPKQ